MLNTFRNEHMHHCFNSFRCSNCFYRDDHSRYTCNAEFTETDDYPYFRNVNTGAHAVRVLDECECVYYVCTAVAENYARYCENDEEFHFDYQWNESSYEYVSQEYAENELYYCDDCGNWFEYDDFNHDLGYCNSCSAYHSIIRGWHDNKHEFETVASPRDLIADYRYKIGAEIEIDCDYCDEQNEQLAKWINRNYIGRFVFERDCSLNNGFEIITQPHTIRALDELDIETLFRECTSRGYRAHDTNTCGLHLHFSREFFGDSEEEQTETLFRVLWFYEDNFDNMLKLSRRDSYRSYADKNSRCNDWEYVDAEDARELVYSNVHGDRYCAVNCTNFDHGHGESTIEFRLGRGTLNADTFRAWIDIHIAIINYCRFSEYDYTNWRGFYRTCSERARAYIDSKLTD